MRRTATLLAMILTAGLSLSAMAQTKLAVTEIKARRGVDPVLAKVVEEFLASEIAKTGRYQVIGRDDILRMLDHDQQKQMMGCSDDSCMAEIGGAMGVDYLAAGSLDRVGKSVLITIKLINVREATVERRETERLRGASEEDALDGVVALVGRMFRGANAKDGDGLSSREVWSIVSAAGAVAFIVTGGALVGVDVADFQEAEDLAAKSKTDPTIRYSEVTNLEDKSNAEKVSGGVILGLGVLAGAAAGVIYFALDDKDFGKTALVTPAVSERWIGLSFTGVF